MVTPTIETQATGESLSIPVDGLSEARVRIAFGGGQMTLGPAEPGVLVSGTFEDGAVDRSTTPGIVEIEPIHPGRRYLEGCRLHWDVRLTSEIPVDLLIESGANQSKLDLSALRIRTLSLQTGASDTTVKLPAQGQTVVRIECGMAQVTVEVPQGIAARVHGRVWFGSTDVDTSRFPKIHGGEWQSADFETAQNKVDINVEGGFGAVRVI